MTTSPTRAPAIEMPSARPARLHHAAYVSADQERTRAFYEDILGLPLTAFWIEREEIGGEIHEFSHAFYELADGSALAFFNFSDVGQQVRYAAKKQELFVHLALKIDASEQDRLRERLRAHDVPVFEADHGFCYSIYFNDPDGQLIELTRDRADAADIDREQRATAHQTLARWLAGDRTPNNLTRPEETTIDAESDLRALA